MHCFLGSGVCGFQIFLTCLFFFFCSSITHHNEDVLNYFQGWGVCQFQIFLACLCFFFFLSEYNPLFVSADIYFNW